MTVSLIKQLPTNLDPITGLSRLSTVHTDPVPGRGQQIGDTYEGTDSEGHRRIYTIRAWYGDGTPQSSGWDAPHSDSCRCNNPEEWY